MLCPVICCQTRPANPGFPCFSDGLSISQDCKFITRMKCMSSKQQRAVKGKAHKVSRNDGWTALSWDDLAGSSISQDCKFITRMKCMSSKQQRAVKGKAHKVSRNDGWTALSWDDLA